MEENENIFEREEHSKAARKQRKQRSKDLKNALKAKRKVANFMEKADKSSTPKVMAVEDVSDDEEMVILDSPRSDEEILGVNEVTLQNLTFVSCDDEIEEYPESEADELNHTNLPYMREFDIGIQYRKLDSNSILVSIEPFKKLYFFGKAIVQVLKGIVDIYGYRFGVNGKKYTVFSAKNHSSLVCVTAKARDCSDSGVSGESELSNYNISTDELMSLPGALIVLEGFENEWCDGLRHTYPDASDMIGPSITGIGPAKLPLQKNFFDKLGFQFVKSTSSNADKYKLLDIPSYWDDIFADLCTQFDCELGKICPFGGKGVGKSTFVRWLTNRYLGRENISEVVFLDLDPGQSEFTPPGMISVHICSEPILGPNFTHLKNPDRAVFLGAVNVADFPISYVKGVAELIEFCSSNEKFQRIPWIINTMGFSQGLGVHIACEIIKLIRPNCVIQINIDNDKRSFPFFLNKENVEKHKTFLSSHLPVKYNQPLEDYNFLNVKSACNRVKSSNVNVWGASAKSLREMVIISYFADKIGLADGFNIRAVVPLRVPLDSIAIGTMNSDLGYDEIVEALNGNLVALCEMSESHFKCVEGTNKKFITNAAEYSNNCFGYGIVRAFDKQAETLFVVTPVQESDILLKVNVILAAGTIGLPMYFYINPADCGNKALDEIPYLMNRREGTSTLHSATRKFFVPKRVTHNVLKNCLL